MEIDDALRKAINNGFIIEDSKKDIKFYVQLIEQFKQSKRPRIGYSSLSIDVRIMALARQCATEEKITCSKYLETLVLANAIFHHDMNIDSRDYL